eukprot:1361230-Rhodomonas_salina.5
MYGTDRGDAATRLDPVSATAKVGCALCLCARYAMSGTDVACVGAAGRTDCIQTVRTAGENHAC